MSTTENAGPRVAYSREEAAAMIGASPAWVSQRIADGSLRSTKINGRRFISHSAIVEFVESTAGR